MPWVQGKRSSGDQVANRVEHVSIPPGQSIKDGWPERSGVLAREAAIGIEIRFQELSGEFRACHREPLNVALHLVTTPLGLLCFLALLWRVSPAVAVAAVAAYLVSLFAALPRRLWTLTAIVVAALLYVSSRLEPGLIAALGGLAVCYLGQDLAHHLASEPTFQSRYQTHPSWLRQFLEHTYYLLPLCMEAAWHARAGEAVLTWLTPRSGTLRVRLNAPSDLLDLTAVRDWVEAQDPPSDTTTHWWYSALESPLRQTVERIAASPRIMEMFRARYGEQWFAVEPLPGMNEIYVASLTHRNNSDAVFYTEHIDGPFMVYPFAAVYRCVVAVNENVQIRTCFPMTPATVTLTTGDVGGFDFNREIHRIEHNAGAENSGRRVTLKLHYCVYPRRLAWYGRLLGHLTTRWDIAARQAFLKSLRPERLFERLLARAILVTTKAYRLLAEYVGGGSVVYLSLLLLAGRLFSAPIFLYGSSFIHYLLYMAVYYTRKDVAFYTFKRRAMFYKGLAVTQLVYLYLRCARVDPLSLFLIALGVALSGSAARVLGMERTYFAAELGLCEPLRLRRFPYSLLKHPMIVGNVIALSGFYALPEFRAAVPYLVPMHIALYLLHLLQERGLILSKPDITYENHDFVTM